MNWYRLPNNLAALLTRPVVAFDGGFSGSSPRTSAVSDGTALVVPMVFAYIVGFVALLAAKLSFILANHPRFTLERLSAMKAGCRDRFFPYGAIFSANLFRRESVDGALALPELVPLQMVMRQSAVLSVPFTAASKTTKARRVCPVWSHLEGASAYFTRFSYHTDIIPHAMGIGTIGVELDAGYFDIARKRIESVQPALMEAAD